MESAENREKFSQPNQSAVSSPHLSKVEIIKLLNESIDRLKLAIEKINESGENLPSSNSINTLIDATKELAPPPPAPVVETTSAKEKSGSTPVKVKPNPTSAPVVKTPANQTNANIPVEVKLDPTPASKPPTAAKTNSIANQRENRALVITGIIATALALSAIVWLWLPQRKNIVPSVSEPATTQIVRSNPEVSPEPTTTGIAKSDRISEPTTTETPIFNPEANPDLLETPTEEIETPIEIPIPQDLTSPGRVENLKVDTIEPELTFTPEQTLIASLQTKLSQLTSNYDSDLFNNVRVDLPTSSLIVGVTDNWYELDESHQDKFVNKILQRSRQLYFNKLEFKDPTGTLVARNPVIGDRAIILQSKKEQ